MPRAGLDPELVTAAGAALADEIGLANLTMGLVAERLGVRTPSLYKHVDSLADLTHRIAVLAGTELGDALGQAIQGRAGSEALSAAAHTMRGYVNDHPGRYTALNTVRPAGPDDPLTAANNRLLDSLTAALRGYHLAEDQHIHALRTLRSMLHGFATLELIDGFRIDTDINDSFTWMINLIDHSLTSPPAPADTRANTD